MAFFGSLEFFAEKRRGWAATRAKARQKRTEGDSIIAGHYEDMATEQRVAINGHFRIAKAERERRHRRGEGFLF